MLINNSLAHLNHLIRAILSKRARFCAWNAERAKYMFCNVIISFLRTVHAILKQYVTVATRDM